MITGMYISNRGGIPRFESNSVTVGSSNVSYTLTNAGNQFNDNFYGLILIKFNQSIPSDTTTTLPIVINNTTQLLTYDNAEVTVADFSGTGIYLAYYDASTKTLQIISGL